MADRERTRTIGDVFYETRVLQGRRWSLKRFATEALDGRIEPVMLSYIEKGERFPSEDLVRHLAAFRREDPQAFLALLWRDRVVYAVSREIDRAFQAAPAVGGVEVGALADRLRRITRGLDREQWVVVNGLQRARPGTAVAPQRSTAEALLEGTPNTPSGTAG